MGDAAEFRWHDIAELFAAYEAASGLALTDLERVAVLPYVAAVPMYFASIAGFTPDPPVRIREEIKSLAIARWAIESAVSGRG